MSVRTLTVASTGLTIAVTPYTVGDQVGNIFAFPASVDAPNGRGVVRGIEILDEGDVMSTCDLAVFSGTVALAGDNNPFAISDADARLLQGYAKFTAADFTDIGNNRLGAYIGADMEFTSTNGTLFVALITQTANAIFTATTDISIRLDIDTGSSLAV